MLSLFAAIRVIGIVHPQIEFGAVCTQPMPMLRPYVVHLQICNALVENKDNHGTKILIAR